FDKSKIDDYARRAKEQWGGTAEYKEFEGKNTARSDKDNSDLIRRTMTFFEKFGELKDLDPADKEVQDLVRELQKFFCENYYNCTDEILLGLGKMYAGGGEFTENIDKAGGTGTAEFVHRAIEIYCK
ncbi:MAG: TipAS antibiotic-recognition domain-containing protein, partial [Oscillospiraceae bacterium]|nr:TipAS antibiotic-recognition domain-containing protein [Oscillospiraceae bacterium]